MNVIITIPPYADYIEEVTSHPIVSGCRLNTVMPMHNSIADLFGDIKSQIGNKHLWIDLKCRQLRVSQGTLVNPPWEVIVIDHTIKLDCSSPVKCFFSDGLNYAYIADVIDGNKLIMLDGPKRLVGSGESINILDDSLEIEGYFTDKDMECIEAAQNVGINNYMLSYVESDDDIQFLIDIVPDAKIISKIESTRGLVWVSSSDDYRSNLMAARGDLYVEVGRPDKIIGALKIIYQHDNNAIVASRILESLVNNPTPSCSDITDIQCMLEIGYSRFMIGDTVCFNKNLLLYALDIMKSMQ